MLVSSATHNAVKQELTNALGKVTELEAQVATLTEQLSAVAPAETETLTSRITELETQLQDAAETVSALEASNVRIEELQAQLTEIQTETAELRSQNAALLAANPAPTAPVKEEEAETKPVLNAYQRAKELNQKLGK